MTVADHECDDPAICPPCQRSTRLALAPPPREWSRPFTARYEGTCTGCGFDIRIGQRICGADMDSDDREYRHEDCVDD